MTSYHFHLCSAHLMIILSWDFQTLKNMQSRPYLKPSLAKKTSLLSNQALPTQKYHPVFYQQEKKGPPVYNTILRKQKQEIPMNYSIDIQHNDQDNRHTSDSEHSNHYLLYKAIEKLAQAQKKSRVKMSSFSWSKTEEKKYISFLKTNSKLFHLSPKQRKEIKINVMMSYAIKTRTSAQCHSHHQKMILKYDNIQSIINQHLYLFDKEVKSQVKAWLPLDNQSRQIQAPFQEEIVVEKESKAEPLWWRYLDLMDEHQESLWQNSYFFSQ